MQSQRVMKVREKTHLPLMMAAGLLLLVGLWGGVSRLGWNFLQAGAGLAGYHGPLMIGGFLGGLIGLERAVAVGRWWCYGAPISAVLGSLALLVGALPGLGASLLLASGLWLSSVSIAIAYRHPSVSVAIIASGAVLWAVGNMLWLAGYPLYYVVPWWAGFLVLTIAGERLELSRLLRPSAVARAGFLLGHVIFVVGLIASLFSFDPGIRTAGAGLGVLGVWLLRYDLASRTVAHSGLHRFMALCLLSGYVWLAIGGLLWAGWAPSFRAGPAYDAMLHAIFLGFVFSMIFAHAPIMFPSITGMNLGFHRMFYGHLVLLHASLLLRVGAGLAGWPAGQRWGGLFNVLALLVFIGNNVRAVRMAEGAVPNPEWA